MILKSLYLLLRTINSNMIHSRILRHFSSSKDREFFQKISLNSPVVIINCPQAEQLVINKVIDPCLKELYNTGELHPDEVLYGLEKVLKYKNTFSYIY